MRGLLAFAVRWSHYTPITRRKSFKPGYRQNIGVQSITGLVIAEHNNASIKGATINTVTAAAAQIAGVSKVINADAEAFAYGLAKKVAAQVLAIASVYRHILFPATAGGKNVAPCVAANLDVVQISDITKVISVDTFEHPN